MDDFYFKRKADGYYLFGVISESSNFNGMLDQGLDPLSINLAGVTSINSTGVRNWVDNLYHFKGTVLFSECSVPIIEQFNMVPEFLGEKSNVLSFYARYYCEDCDHEENILLIPGRNFDTDDKCCTMDLLCPHCNENIDEDFDPEDYFLFIDSIVDRPLPNKNKKKQAHTVQIRRPIFTKVVLPSTSGYPDEEISFAENMSTGGLFILTSRKLERGLTFKVHIILRIGEDEKRITTPVEVKWSRESNPEEGLMAGIGLKFNSLESEHKDLIKKYLSKR